MQLDTVEFYYLFGFASLSLIGAWLSIGALLDMMRYDRVVAVFGLIGVAFLAAGAILACSLILGQLR